MKLRTSAPSFSLVNLLFFYSFVSVLPQAPSPGFLSALHKSKETQRKGYATKVLPRTICKSKLGSRGTVSLLFLGLYQNKANLCNVLYITSIQTTCFPHSVLWPVETITERQKTGGSVAHLQCPEWILQVLPFVSLLMLSHSDLGWGVMGRRRRGRNEEEN